MTKAQLRLVMKERRNSISPEEQSRQSNRIQKKLFQMEEFKLCSSLFSYVSFPPEVATTEIIKTALKSGKHVFVPRVEKPVINFYEIGNYDSLLLSKFGILEPEPQIQKRFTIENDSLHERSPISIPAGNNTMVHMMSIQADLPERKVYLKEPPLMLLPGLAFDKSGNRIGYGAGYYDKYLSTHKKAHFLKIALAYDFQIVDHIEATDFDEKADMIITPNGLIVCGSI